MESIVFHADSWQVLSLAVGILLPVLVGIVTKASTSSGIKATALLFLSGLAALGSELLSAHEAGQSFDLGRGAVVAVGTFIVGVAVHYGLWKPTGVTARVQAIGTPAIMLPLKSPKPPRGHS